MTISTKATIVGLSCGLGVMLAIASAAFSQPALPPPTERERDLYERIAVLQSKLAAQGERMNQLDAKLAAQQKALDNTTRLITDHPKGYSKAFITIGNLNRLPPTDGISYWARY